MILDEGTLRNSWNTSKTSPVTKSLLGNATYAMYRRVCAHVNPLWTRIIYHLRTDHLRRCGNLTIFLVILDISLSKLNQHPKTIMAAVGRNDQHDVKMFFLGETATTWQQNANSTAYFLPGDSSRNAILPSHAQRTVRRHELLATQR